jgi:UDP-hydrolysing UDP-N-acetyl-D-glucosamine 2-epimerase
MNRVHYARQRRLLDVLRRNPRIELQLVVGGAILLDKYGERFLPQIKSEGFDVADTLFNVIDGGNHVAMAKTAGLTALEFSNSLHKLQPDVVLIRGDRFEQLALAMAAAYQNKTIAHIEGGERTGTIDESVRHAITKLAHVHFVNNEEARRRVVRMGENPKHVWNVGSPDIEYAKHVNKKLDGEFFNRIGVGAQIDFNKPYLMAMWHPVTTEEGNALHTENLLKAVDESGLQVIWFWPNNDAGTNEVAKTIRRYREKGLLRNNKIRFLTDVLPEDFIALLKNAAVLAGNSSAGIKEASYFGVPVVNVGTRQEGRVRSKNILDVDYRAGNIGLAIRRQIKHGRYPSSLAYFKPKTSEKIAAILATTPLQKGKQFYE